MKRLRCSDSLLIGTPARLGSSAAQGWPSSSTWPSSWNGFFLNGEPAAADRALHEGEEHVRPGLARAHHVQLVVEHEQVARRRVRQRGVGLVELLAVDVEELAVDLVHGEEARGHAAGAGQEAAPAEAQAAPGGVGEVGDALLDLALLGGLRDRHVLAVRDHARRHRRMQIVHLVGAGQLRELRVAQPDILFAVSSRRHPGLLRCVVWRVVERDDASSPRAKRRAMRDNPDFAVRPPTGA